MSEIIIPREYIVKWYEEKYSQHLGRDSYYGKEDPEIEILINLLKNNKGENKTVLDLGCGDGRYSIRFAKSGFGVVGIDLSKAAKKRVEERAQLEDFSKLIQIINADFVDYNFGKEKFDCITCGEVLQQLSREYVERVIQKMKHTTKRNGYNFIRLPTNIERILPNGDIFWYEDEARYSVYEGSKVLRDLYDDWKILYLYESLFDEQWSLPNTLKHILGNHEFYTRKESGIKFLASRAAAD